MASPAEGARNVRVVSGSNLLTGTNNNLLQVVVQPFVIRLTDSVVVLSALQALATRLGGVIGSLAQFLGGVLTDRLGRRPVMLLGSAFNLASLTCFLASALLGQWLVLIPAFALLGMSLISSPATYAVVAESVAAHGRAMAYSRVQFFLILPAAVVAFAGGYLADTFGVALIFAIGLALEATNFILFAAVLRETLRERNARPWSIRGRLVLQDRTLRGLLLVTCVDSFVWTISSMIIYGMAVVEFGLTETDIGIIVGVWAVVFAATTLPSGWIVQRFGSRWIMFVSEALGIPVMLGWILSRTVVQFAVISVFNGLTASTWVPAWQTVLADSVEDRVRGEVAGRITAIRGLLAFPAPLLGGFLYTTFGYAAPMVASFVGMIVAMAAVLRFVPDRRYGVRSDRRSGPTAGATR